MQEKIPNSQLLDSWIINRSCNFWYTWDITTVIFQEGHTGTMLGQNTAEMHNVTKKALLKFF